MRRLPAILALLALVALAIVFATLGTAGGSSHGSDPPGSSPPAPLTGPSRFTTGIVDPIYSTAGGDAWLGRTAGAGARFILVWVNWAQVAPQRPAAGSDPSDPAYVWGTLDATVRAATANHLAVVLSIANAPVWAEGRHRPRRVAAGAWRPNAAAYGAMAEATARRYSGSYDPGTGRLPRVRYFQAWTEPNFSSHLAPQWVRVGGHQVAESPVIYRGLLNSFYAGVKAVHRSDVVLSAGTAPFGDPRPGHGRVQPALFVRDLLCLQGQELAREPCPDPAHFDILAHDPYSFGGPRQPAYWPDDVSLVDLWKLTRILAVAQRTGRALPRVRHPVWVTEFGWVTDPPNGKGVPVVKRARWIEESFYQLWLQGISTATWFQIVDQSRQVAGGWQSGLYYSDGRRKPGFEAFRFPFLVYRAGRGWAQVWGVSPDSGTVRVQALQDGRWVTLVRAPVRARSVIDRTVSVSGHPLLRAVIGHDRSLGWRA